MRGLLPTPLMVRKNPIHTRVYTRPPEAKNNAPALHEEVPGRKFTSLGERRYRAYGCHRGRLSSEAEVEIGPEAGLFSKRGAALTSPFSPNDFTLSDPAEI